MTGADWIYRRRSPVARMRLFCLPYAGGGAGIYSRWQSEFPAEIEVCAVELPGRRARLGEAPFRRIGPMVQAVTAGLAPYLDLPFAFFGHSLGALVAYELYHHQVRTGGVLPGALFLSGAVAPHQRSPEPPIWGLGDDEFLMELRSYGGIPEALFAEAEMLRMFLPALRADFEVYQTYRWTPRPPVTCPVYLYGGEQDHVVPPARVSGWADLAAAETPLRLFAGGHFYLHDQRGALTTSVARQASRLLTAPAVAAAR